MNALATFAPFTASILSLKSFCSSIPTSGKSHFGFLLFQPLKSAIWLHFGHIEGRSIFAFSAFFKNYQKTNFCSCLKRIKFCYFNAFISSEKLSIALSKFSIISTASTSGSGRLSFLLLVSFSLQLHRKGFYLQK